MMRLIPISLKKSVPVWITFAVLAIGCSLSALTGWLDRQPVVALPKGIDSWGERARDFDIFHRLELILYDLRVRQAARFAPQLSTNLGMVTITDSTLRRLSKGFPLGEAFVPPYPRHLYGRAIRELNRQGATAIGMDILLPDPRSNDREVEWVEDGATNDISSDKFLSNVMKKYGNVYAGALSDLPPARGFRGAAADLAGVDSSRDMDGSVRRVYAFQECEYISLPLEGFANRHSIEVTRQPDGSLEQFDLNLNERSPFPLNPDRQFTNDLRGKLIKTGAFENPRKVWHLGIVMAANVLGLDLDKAEILPDAIRLRGTNGVERIIPLDHKSSFLIHWTHRTESKDVLAQPIEALIADDLQNQEGQTNTVEPIWTNRVVVMGSTATGNNVADLGPTPLANSDFRVASYINIANSIIQDRFIKRLPIGGELVCELVLGVIGAWVTLRRKILVAALVVAAVAVGYLGFAFWIFIEGRLWIPVAHPIISGLLLNHAVMLTWRVVFEQREQRRVRGIFSKIVSPDVVQELLRSDQHALGGSRRKLTVFFADIRGFTEMTDQFQAAAEEHVRANRLTGADAQNYYENQASAVLATVNTYLATIADVVKSQQGTLDKYIGDCVMAFWGSPLSEEKHAVRCVAAAIEAQRAIQQLNREREAENTRRETENQNRPANGLAPLPKLPTLQLGTGINTGEMTVGLMGSESHIMNYTVFGREVNLAARLEGVSGRSRIIIGEGTYLELVQHAPELAKRCKALEPVGVKGFRQLVPIFEVPWDDDIPVSA